MGYGYHLRDKVQRPKRGASGWGAGLLATLLIFGVLGPALAQGVESDFRVEMVSPQRFHIEPRVAGPVSSSLVGGGGNQTLITRQENGRTIIDAEIPVGAVLHLQVGERGMRLKMVDSQHYQCWED
jgi:hypothetical protein